MQFANDEQGGDPLRPEIELVADFIHPASPLQTFGSPFDPIYPPRVMKEKLGNPTVEKQVFADGFHVGTIKRAGEIWHEMLERDRRMQAGKPEVKR